MVCGVAQFNLLKAVGGKSGLRPCCTTTPAVFFLGDDDVKRIPLTQGKFAIVDDADYEYLMQWKWYAVKDKNTYYAMRNQRISESGTRARRTTILMHRAIMKVQTGLQIDHINHNGLDNRKANMRICTNKENHYNQLSQRNKTSKYRGVSRDKNRWRADIQRDKNKLYLGSYVSEIKAALAYDNKATMLFGSFAHLNIKQERTHNETT